MNSIRKIIVMEDEKLNAERIRRLLLKIRPGIEIAGIFATVKNTVEWLSKNEHPDLVIMDIQLADGLSFEVFDLIEIKSPVIFVTAYDQYAVKAFEYNSIAYLLKPIEEEGLLAAVAKFENAMEPLHSQHVLIKALLSQIHPREYRTRFLVPHRDSYKKINVEDISLFYSHDNICYATLATGERIVVPQTLETLEQELPPKSFFRANRQYIVSAQSIEQVHNFFNGKLKLKIKNNQEAEIMISRTKAPLFKLWLDF